MATALFGRRFRFLCLGLVVVGVGCASPQGSPAGGERESRESREPKSITVVVMGEVNALNSKINSTLATVGQRGADEAERIVLSGLTTLDNRDVRHPQLAQASPTAENGLWQVFPDGRMETTWKVRPAARWHDRTPFTAEDVLFTWRISTDRDLAMSQPAYFSSVDTVEAPDPLTIKVKWNRPFISADDLFSSSLMPRHLLEGPYLENKATFLEQPYWNQEFVGTGPFRLREFARSSHVRVFANDDYVLGRPKIDEVEIRFIGDPSTLIANFLAGTVDLTLNTRFSLEQVTPILPQWPEGRMELETTQAIMFYPQMLNPTPAAVADVRFRRALVHALDRQEMADTLQGGIVPVAHSLVHPDDGTYPAIQGRIVRYDYDPRTALQMIENLGYVRRGGGLFRDAAGQPLQVEIRVTAGRDITTKSTLAMADYWQKVGVTTEANIVPQQRSQDREYMASFPSFYIANQGTGNLNGGTFTRVRIAGVGLPENNFRATGNWPRYINSEYEALVERFLVTIPLAQRTEILGQIIHHITDQAIITTLFFNPLPLLVNNRVRGVTANNQGWNVQEWDVTR